MSFLNLVKRLQPAKKAWKIFTTKLHTKLLHKLNRSKSMKKPVKRLKPTTKAVPWPALALKPRFKHRRHAIQSTRIFRSYHRRKRPPPVHIDHPFIEPPASAGEHLQPPRTVASHMGEVREKRSQQKREAKLPCRFADDVCGTSKEVVEGNDMISDADGMWESLALASPLMHGIDERAEEFITRIRGEMQLQEMMARRLYIKLWCPNVITGTFQTPLQAQKTDNPINQYSSLLPPPQPEKATACLYRSSLHRATSLRGGAPPATKNSRNTQGGGEREEFTTKRRMQNSLAVLLMIWERELQSHNWDCDHDDDDDFVEEEPKISYDKVPSKSYKKAFITNRLLLSPQSSILHTSHTSFLNLVKRLQPAKKAWKIFTTKLHTKLLRKLKRSKSIKKPMKRLKPTTKAVPWPTLAFKPRLKHRRHAIQSTRIFRSYHRQKRPPPVYIDHP
ncbi:hypothetical protein RHSIM_Rhsim13G0035000 [Rhododendron simsii]|uniref:Uncharacterized protein n=1 Tax=Rhododendron simsii TaxID=118357 RepID=A0A834G0N4_RHOSS|nr:hypothetical protein RHSIM_Rhsim13G0035000 [Rhododendron simsii]